MDIQFARLSSEASITQVISFMPTVDVRSGNSQRPELALTHDRQIIGICNYEGTSCPFTASSTTPEVIHIMKSRQSLRWVDGACINYETALNYGYKISIDGAPAIDLKDVDDKYTELCFPIIDDPNVTLHVSSDFGKVTLNAEDVKFFILSEAWRQNILSPGLKTPLHSNGPSMVLRPLIDDNAPMAHDYSIPDAYYDDIVSYLRGGPHIPRGKEGILLRLISRLAGGSGGRDDKQMPRPFDYDYIFTPMRKRGQLVSSMPISDDVMKRGTTMYLSTRPNVLDENYVYRATSNDLVQKEAPFSVFQKNSSRLTRARMVLSLYYDKSISDALLINDCITVMELAKLSPYFMKADGFLSSYRHGSVPHVEPRSYRRAFTEVMMMNEDDTLKFCLLCDLGLLSPQRPTTRLEACILLGMTSGRLA